MSEAANIGVIFGGDIGPLKDSVKKAETILDKFAGMATTAGKAVLGIGTAGATAAAGGMVALTKSAAESARQIQIMASVANVSVETMQKMGYASQTVQVPMEKMSEILKDVNDKLGDFSEANSGGMKDFFENIAPQVGLTAEAFKKLSGDEALIAYYNALEQANVSQQDMTFYMEAIAGDATRLIPLLKNNGEGFRAMAAEAEALGTTMSAIDIAQLEQASRAFDRAKEVIKGAGNAIAVDFVPYLTLALDTFVDATKSVKSFGEQSKSSFSPGATALKLFLDAINYAHIGLKGLEIAFASVGTAAAAAFGGLNKVLQGVANSAINLFNLMIDGMNMLPGIDIERIGLATFGDAMDSTVDMAVENLKRLKSEIVELSTGESYGDSAIKALDEIKIKSREAAEEAAKIAGEQFQKGKSGTSYGKAEDKEKEDDAAEKLAREAEIEAMRREMAIQSLKDRYMTEEELLKQHRETMAIIGEEYDATQFESESQWRSIREQAQAEHTDNMNRLREMERANAVAIAGDLAQSIMSLSQGQSRKVFEFSKKAAVASAVIDGYKAATSAWAAGMSTGGPWAPLVAASYTAASLAKTGAQVRAISSQSFGSGGGQGDVGGSGVPSMSAGGGGGFAQPNAGGGNAGTVAINLPAGAIIRGDALLDMIEEAVNNGKNVSFLRA